MNFMVEILNVFVICTSFDPITILANFVILQVISQFDNYMYESLGGEPFKKLLSDDIANNILIVHHTTSKRCSEEEISTLRDDNDVPRPLRITWGSRNFSNKIMYFFYKMSRLFFVVIYFYFVPMSVFYFSI